VKPSPVSRVTRLSLTEAATLLREKQVSPVELTCACLERIERLDPTLRAFITVTADDALAQARAAETEIARGGWRGPLHGMPLALKDLIDTAGVRTTAASAVFRHRVPEKDAEVTRRLKAAGAVLLGKLNLHEFAYGGSGIIGAYGVARNPWDLSRITGGSSSGSAAAVAAGLCFGALGTDTAGSIRLPAALCGIVGLKPTYGLVSARGVIPLAWSYDHVGPMTRSVADAAAILQAIAGYDPGDPDSQSFPPQDYLAATQQRMSKPRIGVAREYFFAELDAEVAAAVDRAIALIGELATEVRDISVPVAYDRELQTCESYAFHSPLLAQHAEHYYPETLRRIQRGAGVSAATYIQKRHELTQLRRAAADIFRDVDLLLTPAVPVPAPSIAELEAEFGRLRERELLLLRNTRPFNALGLPAITVPCGFTRGGLPIGLQISGAPGADAGVLRLAYAYEQATEWHQRFPDLD